MSNFISIRTNEDDILSHSSDEKMDTSSESFHSTQHTPNSVLSSEFDDKEQSDVLRLQNPDTDNSVLRMSVPENNSIVKGLSSNLKKEINDSLITKMSNLNLDSPMQRRPLNLGIGSPRLCSTLISTVNHPLMGLGSPDENFPDVVPKKSNKVENDKELSLSIIEDERPDTNGYEFYREKNSSKNNLYYSDNFVTADSDILNDIDNIKSPDVARVKMVERREIVSKFVLTPEVNLRRRNTDINCDINNDDDIMINARLHKSKIYSTPGAQVENNDNDMPHKIGFQSGVPEWSESTPQPRPMPNFELPIELSAKITHNKAQSPDVVSLSPQEDRSAYEALVDPYTGSVALRPTAAKHSPGSQRRKIHLPPEARWSIDSGSVCSLESEEDLPEFQDPQYEEQKPSVDQRENISDDDEDTKRSTTTMSSSSEPIPEYSAAEEFKDERSWLSVTPHVTCDMKVIEPYKRVVSHGGYDSEGAALVVLSACHLPDCARADYHYVMDNLFLYVIWTMERLVTDDYILVYMHGSASRRRMPTFHWLHECYKLIDRRLRKSLKHMYLVHPTIWLKTIVLLTKPFVSSKFFRKLSYVCSLSELRARIPIDAHAIPDLVKEYDEKRR